jgi:hypothetical protein
LGFTQFFVGVRLLGFLLGFFVFFLAHGVIFLFGFVGLAQFFAWLSQFFIRAAVGETIYWACGGHFVFGFRSFLLSGGRKTDKTFLLSSGG